jgi:hypothetical protein
MTPVFYVGVVLMFILGTILKLVIPNREITNSETKPVFCVKSLLGKEL